jgi:hypothetical protein
MVLNCCNIAAKQLRKSKKKNALLNSATNNEEDYGAEICFLRPEA